MYYKIFKHEFKIDKDISNVKRKGNDLLERGVSTTAYILLCSKHVQG